MIALALGAWRWLRDHLIAAALIGAAILGAIIDIRARRAGRAAAERDAREASDAGTIQRHEARDEADLRARGGGARERLRDRLDRG